MQCGCNALESMRSHFVKVTEPSVAWGNPPEMSRLIRFPAHADFCKLDHFPDIGKMVGDVVIRGFAGGSYSAALSPGTLNIAGQNALDGAGVVSAEQDAVHQQRVEVIEIAAQLEETRRQGAMFAVAREKGLAEGVEQG